MLFFYTVLMVPSSAFIATTGGVRSPCDVFSLGETIRFKSLEFIANRFGGMSLPLKDGSGAIIMGPACGEPPLLQQTMMGGPIEGSPRLLMGKGGPASPSHGDAAWRFLPLQPRPYHGRRTLWLIKL
jgi:hypothetical protein